MYIRRVKGQPAASRHPLGPHSAHLPHTRIIPIYIYVNIYIYMYIHIYKYMCVCIQG